MPSELPVSPGILVAMESGLRTRGLMWGSRALVLLGASAACGISTEPAADVDGHGSGAQTSAVSAETTTSSSSGSPSTGMSAEMSTCDDGICDSSETEGESATVDCTVPSYAPSIVVDRAHAVELGPEFALEMGTGDGHAFWACGRAGVAHASAQATKSLPWSGLEGSSSCKGIVALGSGHALSLSSSGRLGLFEHDGGALRLVHELQLGQSLVFDEIAYDFEVAGDATGATIWVAQGVEGIAVVELRKNAGDSQLVEQARWLGHGHRGARAIAAFGGEHLLTADAEGGVHQLALDGRSTQSHEGLGAALRAVGDGQGRVAVLRGGLGFSVFELVDDAMVFRGDAVPPGRSAAARFVADDIVVATGAELVRFAIDRATNDPFPRLETIAAHERPGRGQQGGQWWRSLSEAGPMAAMTASAIVPFALGDERDLPSLWFDRGTQSMFLYEGEDVALGLVIAANRGRAALVIDGVEVPEPFHATLSEELLVPREGCEGQYEVSPGATFFLPVEYRRGPARPHRAQLELSTNDPYADAGSGRVWLEGDRPASEVGSLGVDMPLLTQNGRMFTLSDFRGRYLLVKAFNSE